ncbi:nose resistant to fluoxetine protein 6-like [Brevipalpus obovatus]|uniref:nose resistant to fluoxetine protein 6-like n=1 Tax=Brevipalpus obovatus TaxID=246614 RepID=UPI003D9F013A
MANGKLLNLCYFFIFMTLSSISCENILSEKIIDSRCNESLILYQTALSNRSTWAIRMLDAQGKLGPGLLDGSKRLIGSYDECVNLHVASSGSVDSFDGLYCSVQVVFNITDDILLSYSNKTTFVTELCVPSTCAPSDIEIHLLKTQTATEARTLYCEGSNSKALDASEIIIICIFVLLGFSIILGTFLDAWFRTRGEKAIKKRAKILVSFSLYTNTLKIMNTHQKNSNINCINGLKVLAMIFIVLGHTYNFQLMMIPTVNPQSIQRGIKELWFQAFLNFSPWVDTFFLTSGILMVFTSLRTFQLIHLKYKENGNTIIIIGRFMIRCVSLVARRYWRLTPAVGFMICLYIISARFSSGPNWAFMENYVSNSCKRLWWRNLLYVTNFFPGDMCMGHTWYICCEFQFYIFGLLLITYLSSSFVVIGILLVIISLITSLISTAVVAFLTSSSPTWLAVEPNGTESPALILYIWPFFRIGPYLIGMIVGYFMAEGVELRLSKRKNAISWMICLLILLSITFASYRWTNGDPASIPESTAYATFHRTVWAICWAFIIWSCHSGHSPLVDRILSWKAFIPLSRITYQCYLIHLLFIYIHESSNRTAFAFSHYNMFILFAGYLTISYTFAYISAICFEYPFANLELVLFPKRRTPEVTQTAQPVGSTNPGFVGSMIFDKEEQIESTPKVC